MERESQRNVGVFDMLPLSSDHSFFVISSPPPLCGCIPCDDKYKCKPSDQVSGS